MHDPPLLITIGVALAVAFVGGLLARRIGLPTIVGYLLAGVAIGPFTPGFVGDVESISQLAELGVIFLMFGVGLHFSLQDLWQVRDIAIPGTLIRMALVTALGFAFSQVLGWSIGAGLVLGIAVSIASTVVLLRGLADFGLLDTRHGRVAIGSVVTEDIATVLILVALPALNPAEDAVLWQTVGVALLKAAAFIALMLVVGARIVPWTLLRVIHTRSRELFILLILVIALGIALGSAEFFNVSLALGAFLAGVVVSESPFSHQVGAEILPFREAFAVLFFVSVGMLVNPMYLLAHAWQVLALTALIIIGKPLITVLIGVCFPHPVRTALVLGAGLSTIGEFSFIVGSTGLALGLLDRDQYSLILAGALLSITLNPLLFRLIDPLEKRLQQMPALWNFLNRQGTPPAAPQHTLADHVVIVGYGRVGKHIVEVLNVLGVPQLMVEVDPQRLDALHRINVPVLFGDAANSELLQHAMLQRARALVVTVPSEPSAAMIVAAARQIAPDLPIIVRAATTDGIGHLAGLGANDVIHPELEGGLEIVRHALLRLGYPPHEVQNYTDAVRDDHYEISANTQEEHRMLRQLVEATGGIEITWFRIDETNPLIGQTLEQANIRARSGASVIAIMRGQQVIANPKSNTTFESGDRVGLIGDADQVAEAETIYFTHVTQLP